MQSVNNCGFKTGGGGGSPAATTPRCFNQLKHPGIYSLFGSPHLIYGVLLCHLQR